MLLAKRRHSDADHSLLTPGARFVTSRRPDGRDHGPWDGPADGQGNVMAGSTAPTAIANPAADPQAGSAQALVFVLGRRRLGRGVAGRARCWPARTRPPRSGGTSGNSPSCCKAPTQTPPKHNSWPKRVRAHKQDDFPALAGEADFNLGGALMRQAAQTDGARAADLWAEAHDAWKQRTRRPLPGGRPPPVAVPPGRCRLLYPRQAGGRHRPDQDRHRPGRRRDRRLHGADAGVPESALNRTSQEALSG